MDWSECPLIEVKPGVQHGRPVLRGTRMPADDIVENWEAGVDESAIAEDFRQPIEQVKAILTYASGHQSALSEAINIASECPSTQEDEYGQ